MAKAGSDIEQGWGASAAPTAPLGLRPEPASGLGHSASVTSAIECHGLDTPERVCFYEQDFYVLSNFSAFSVTWQGIRFDTSEHLYHWLKFATSPDNNSCNPSIASDVLNAPSAHAAFKIAELYRAYRRPDWDAVKVDFMRDILRAKVNQHEYVHRKLLATGDRELVENSWRDDYWGWGPNRDGQNMLGKLWMDIRAEARAALASAEAGNGR
jgi:ribA/ribD-fused uncharacterized protein